MQELAHLPKALEQTQHSLRLVKENNTVLATAIGVEKGVQEAMDEYMDEAAKEIQKLRARFVLCITCCCCGEYAAHCKLQMR